MKRILAWLLIAAMLFGAVGCGRNLPQKAEAPAASEAQAEAPASEAKAEAPAAEAPVAEEAPAAEPVDDEKPESEAE